jgi:hypothetical protein
MSGTPPPSKAWNTSHGVSIDSRALLGQGLSHKEWKDRLGGQWNGQKNNLIIEELEFFKSEIQPMRSEPPITKGRTKSNSLASILLRLQGLPWAEGEHNDRGKRLHEVRLLGKDAK